MRPSRSSAQQNACAPERRGGCKETVPCGEGLRDASFAHLQVVVARICASAVVPPQVLAEASEALAGEHLPAVVPPQGVAALNKALAGKHVPAPNVQ